MVQAEEAELPISLAQRQLTTSRIARAVLNFQDKLLEGDANTGSLCQVPVRPEAGAAVMHSRAVNSIHLVPAGAMSSQGWPATVGCCVKPYLSSSSCTAVGCNCLQADW